MSQQKPLPPLLRCGKCHVYSTNPVHCINCLNARTGKEEILDDKKAPRRHQ